MKEVNAWMDKMGLRKVVFVGNSLGGAIAWNMALVHPEKVEKLVLIDAGGFTHGMCPSRYVLRVFPEHRLLQGFFGSLGDSGYPQTGLF